MLHITSTSTSLHKLHVRYRYSIELRKRNCKHIIYLNCFTTTNCPGRNPLSLSAEMLLLLFTNLLCLFCASAKPIDPALDLFRKKVVLERKGEVQLRLLLLCRCSRSSLLWQRSLSLSGYHHHVQTLQSPLLPFPLPFSMPILHYNIY
jgi:hypothetical protein